MTSNFNLCAVLLSCILVSPVAALAQEQPEGPRPPAYRELPQELEQSISQDQASEPQLQATREQAPEPLTEEQLEVLVARIALYPDELVAVISAASLYPLQIVEAARYIENKKTNPALKPKETWDGSVVSLLNYPEILKMMSDDLDWTQALGEALAYQQKDVLAAIQNLREKAVAEGVIKTDDKIKVTNEAEKVVIEPKSPETVYVPRYEPEMLYEPGYAWAPVDYYPYAYPNYYLPTAPYFAAFVTGVIWVAVIDWDDWGIWGGDWDDDEIHIHCHHCFKDRHFDRKMRWKDVDWKKVDRSKIKFDENQLTRMDRRKLERDLKARNQNDLRKKSAELSKTRGFKKTLASTLTDKTGMTKNLRRKDLRRDAAEGFESVDSRESSVAERSNIAGDKKAEKFDRRVDSSKRLAAADNGYQKAKKIRSDRKSKRIAKTHVKAKKQALRKVKRQKFSLKRAKRAYGLEGGGKKIKKKRGRRRG
jgi:uncharacterized protein DUF3300